MISNELSSEIAAAILAEKKSPQELKELKDIILQVHSELQRMSEDARTTRLKTRILASNRMRDHGGY